MMNVLFANKKIVLMTVKQLFKSIVNIAIILNALLTGFFKI